jgi:integrase
VAELRGHWKAQQEQRLSIGLGEASSDDLVFANWDGSARLPNGLTKEFADAMERAGLAHVTLHTLRHTHASQLITSGMDILTISRRLGHSSPAITLTVYGHLLTSESGGRHHAGDFYPGRDSAIVRAVNESAVLR